MQKQIIMKEKNLILRRVKKDLKIEIDLNHLSLKSTVEETEIELFEIKQGLSSNEQRKRK